MSRTGEDLTPKAINNGTPILKDHGGRAPAATTIGPQERLTIRVPVGKRQHSGEERLTIRLPAKRLRFTDEAAINVSTTISPVPSTPGRTMRTPSRGTRASARLKAKALATTPSQSVPFTTIPAAANSTTQAAFSGVTSTIPVLLCSGDDRVTRDARQPPRTPFVEASSLVTAGTGDDALTDRTRAGGNAHKRSMLSTPLGRESTLDPAVRGKAKAVVVGGGSGVLVKDEKDVVRTRKRARDLDDEVTKELCHFKRTKRGDTPFPMLDKNFMIEEPMASSSRSRKLADEERQQDIAAVPQDEQLVVRPRLPLAGGRPLRRHLTNVEMYYTKNAAGEQEPHFIEHQEMHH